MEYSCMGRPLADFRIVFPENCSHGEDFLAYELQCAIYRATRMVMPITHCSTGAEAYEILIGGTSSEPGFWTVDTEGHKLVIRGTNLFGYMDAATFFNDQIFYPEPGRFDGVIPKNWHKKRLIYQDVFEKKTASYRIIFQNVWGMDCPAVANRANYIVEYCTAFGADVIGLNEYFGDFLTGGAVQQRLEANGYAEVPVKKDASLFQGSVEPIFYRTAKLRLLESGYVDFWMHDASKGATVAVFEDADAPEKRFAAICTHLSAAYACTQAEKYLRQLKNLQFLLPEVDRVCRQWGEIPIFIGGDFNCYCTTETFQKMLLSGFSDVHEIAEYTNDRCSCHGYPVYCSALHSFVTGTLTNEAPYRDGIDHVFVRNEKKARITMYRTMQESIVPVISDHCPHLLDFDILGEKGETV